ncbi:MULTISPECIES: NAD-dependent epimerase/dehydratase family protein [Enterobacterales]|uniref:NAD-dependent epimerase/dehydratase family protein n=1 Tax=Enterobacterales TaxID=91347 RepID=UPI00143DC9B1|nr:MULTISPECIES: NAD(P)-dependent oxidoreductase [Enterobacterales]MBA6167752.1 NAD(P)-dependent oxidoreductase [Klebsiella variicola]MBA6183460.1 NAD(P)-dependent oxidoreductase [Klebsiella variicola]MBU9861265.1 NAD(P)-dependent oxidoreductase [Rahnella aceris]UWX16658.1 NAD(P)-dependent oxidoreductase [Klebsiella pneumoniae]UWX22048.1 NAD(P)-dependent oxidoreductase [Klebsiella pneumoniae]
MTILVTGATGPVGTRLLPRLIAAGLKCRVLVRSGKLLPAGVTAVEGDILDPASLRDAVKGVDTVIHLAAVLRTPEAQQIWQVNLEGSRNLINAVKEHAGGAQFIMASTGLVYSMGGQAPSRETDPVSPERDYPASKAAAEKLLQESGLNWSVLRFGFVYGDNDGHIGQIPHIAGLLKLHPANRLSMIHHRDIATFIKMGLNGALDGKIVNAVDDAPMSIFELSEMAGSPMKQVSAPLDNPWGGVMDGSLAQSLGFRPEVATTWQAARENAL